MDRLLIEETKATPYIDFNPDGNSLKIKGQSYPENAFKFYEPVLKWIDEYIEEAKGEITIEINFEMPYINSSSSKCILMLLDKLENAFQEGKDIVINWYYDEENESSLECAEEFKEDISLPFNIIKS
ncbi:DUF1987 domain-containing protein [Clostridium thailandense]|uniref:DUF1987 domain-containing protein n=1 Tax=Clostridium thailandense TaxID=2794346 RepID=A0A949WR68_9CLOT|nr:DUF1987 domain-containing protein [Clostridium thailandense]MBV7273650.1 DUF1987 domain-containing protein [Clostridium thailandense]MCH5137042.1 DUF1987 domain-containing protein [Clostridiaceae bacterium UIB06]